MKLKQDTEFEVSCLAHCLVDVLAKVQDNDPEKVELSKGAMTLVDEKKSKKILEYIQSQNKELSLGGSGLNTTRVLAILGANTFFSGTVGNDEYGDFLKKEVQLLQIIEDIQIIPDQPTGVCISLITPDAERTMATNLGASDCFSLKNIQDFNKLLNAKIYYTTGYKLTKQNNKEAVVEAAKRAKQAGVVVAFDLADASILKAFKKEYEEILTFCDILFMNHEEANAFAGNSEEAIKKLNTTAKLIVVKTGKQGCLIHDSEKKENILCGGFVASANDTTGAGDSFAAGFLYGLVKGFSLKNCGMLANFVGSRVVQNMGATVTSEDLNEIKILIKKIESSKQEED